MCLKLSLEFTLKAKNVQTFNSWILLAFKYMQNFVQLKWALHASCSWVMGPHQLVGPITHKEGPTNWWGPTYWWGPHQLVGAPPIGGGPTNWWGPPQLVGARGVTSMRPEGEIASLNFLIDNGFTSCVARFSKCSKFQPNPQASFRSAKMFWIPTSVQQCTIQTIIHFFKNYTPGFSF